MSCAVTKFIRKNVPEKHQKYHAFQSSHGAILCVDAEGLDILRPYIEKRALSTADRDTLSYASLNRLARIKENTIAD